MTPTAIQTPFRLFGLIAALTVTGCAMGGHDDPELASSIREHYAAHATEEEGACRNPKIDTIQAHPVVERSEDGGEVMLVRYSYFDRHVDMEQRWSRLVHLNQPCGGIAERRFELMRDERGYRVIAMDGEHSAGERSR